MKEKLIRIKRSRYKPEELYLIDMINELEELHFKDNIHWSKYDRGIYIQNYLTYNPRGKYLIVNKFLVYDKLYDLFGEKIIILKLLKDFCSSYLKLEINEIKL